MTVTPKQHKLKKLNNAQIFVLIKISTCSHNTDVIENTVDRRNANVTIETNANSNSDSNPHPKNCYRKLLVQPWCEQVQKSTCMINFIFAEKCDPIDTNMNYMVSYTFEC